MKKQIAARKAKDLSRDKTNAVYKIPVVVHILHNGESVGNGANISDAQVLSQIRVLNEDYQRLNADAVNTPAEFVSVASSINLEFVLAKQDPDGLPTTGITRTLANKNGYTAADDVELKSQVYWPAENYLNIWVTNLTGSYLGYAQFPQTSLQGPEPPYDRTTDGVVVHYRAFGSIDDGAFNLLPKYNKGRTTTHEVGHFFSLIHIFGDFNDCNTTDFVSDTPVQKDRTFSCPDEPVEQCGHHVMYQNYLDYTDDACMNLFTAGQISRIETVLDGSPRRESLLASPGLNDPVVLDLDLEAKSVTSPFEITCGQSIVPKLVIRNRGENTITSAKITLAVNGSVVETKDVSLNMDLLDIETISFNTIDLVEPSVNDIAFNIIQVNGTTDEQPDNNSISMASEVTSRLSTPIFEAFNSTPATWQIVNPDNSTTWQNKTAPKSNATNKAMFIDLYNYQNNSSRDQLISPFIDITSVDALLRFDHAYAMFPAINTERLRVLISAGCSTDFSEAIEIYNKEGADLATAATQSTAFVPSGSSQWTSDGISLGAYNGQVIRLIFETTNANGNNLYLDNVQISTGLLSDVRVVSMVSPGPVFCDSKTQPVVEVQNLGTEVVTTLDVMTEVNGVVNASESFTNLDMTPGTLLTLTLAKLNLTQANNNFEITVTNPDAAADDSPSDNAISLTRIFNTSRDIIPTRQNFDENVSNWTIYSDADHEKWEGTSTNTYKNGLVYEAFDNPNVGNESWFVSPVLDMSRASEGSLFFATSYGRRQPRNEALRVMVSEDCGLTYDEMIFEKSGADLSNKDFESEWTPGSETDWRTEYVSINDYAGKDNVRFAFVVTNDNGNNVYLDNVEFFMEDNPEPPKTQELFSVYNSETNPYEFLITFNLPEKQDARLVVYNSVGQMLIDSELPATLNQTYTVNLYGQSAGIYVARLLTPSLTSSSKLFVGK